MNPIQIKVTKIDEPEKNPWASRGVVLTVIGIAVAALKRARKKPDDEERNGSGGQDVKRPPSPSVTDTGHTEPIPDGGAHQNGSNRGGSEFGPGTYEKPQDVQKREQAGKEDFSENAFRRKETYGEKAPLQLVCRGGYQDGRSFPLAYGTTVTIGRDAGCVIRYPADYPGVSRHHASLQWETLGGEWSTGPLVLTLRDTSSTGTLLERLDKVIPRGESVPVRAGDVFYIGERKNRFEIVSNQKNGRRMQYGSE